MARRARKPLARWFWSDTTAQLPALGLSLMALMLAMAANIGVGTMVSSFRAAFEGFLDQRLVSDLYVILPEQGQRDALHKWADTKTVDVLPIWHIDTVLNGQKTEIYGVADHMRYRQAWPMQAALPDVWQGLYDGKYVLISEQMARRAMLSPGEQVTLADGWTLTVGGVYSDYGNTGFQAIVDLPELLDQYPGIERRRHGILAGQADPDALQQSLIETLDLPPGAVTDRRSVRDFSLGIFDRTFAVTAALNVLTLGVAGFALLTTFLTLARMRLPQLAPVWAIGLPRAQLARLEVLRATVLALLTFVVALPVGLILAVILLRVVNAEAFGWQLPVQLFPKDWLVLLIAALVAGVGSAIWPAYRLARITPARLSQVFAHER